MAAEINQQLTPQVYGSVVIGQNYVVKKRRLEEYEAQQKAVSHISGRRQRATAAVAELCGGASGGEPWRHGRRVLATCFCALPRRRLPGLRAGRTE